MASSSVLSSPASSSRFWLWCRERLWDQDELTELLRLCASEEALLDELVWVCSTPIAPPPVCRMQGPLRVVVPLLAEELGGDVFLFFQPETEADWELAGRLAYDLLFWQWTGDAQVLLQVRRRGAALVTARQLPRDPYLLAFLHGFVRRFLLDRGHPPPYCPLRFPAGVFLEEVSLEDPLGTCWSSDGRGWLLLRPWEIPCRCVCLPPPAEAVEVEVSHLDRPYPWG